MILILTRPKAIYNMDETGVPLEPQPPKVVAKAPVVVAKIPVVVAKTSVVVAKALIIILRLQ